MRSPIRVLTDWTQTRKLKTELMLALQRTPVGNGLRILNPGDPIVARALIELLNENAGSVELLDYGIEASLIRTDGLVKAVGADQHNKLHKHYDVLNAENLSKLKLTHGHALPARQFRDGVPDDFNGDPDLPQWRNPSPGGLVDANGRPIVTPGDDS
jgi:hypothetical protein